MRTRKILMSIINVLSIGYLLQIFLLLFVSTELEYNVSGWLLALMMLDFLVILVLITVLSTSFKEKHFFLTYEELLKKEAEANSEYKIWSSAVRLVGFHEAVKFVKANRSNRMNRNHWIYRRKDYGA